MIAPSLLLVLAAYVSAKIHLQETFTDASFQSWVTSDWKGADSMGKWDISSGDWNHGDVEAAQGMRTTEDARFYAISKKLDQPFTNKDQTLVVQFGVKNEKKGTSFCGGGYIKLLPADTDQAKFGGDSPYYIMFGPDLCGYDVSRVHLIFNAEGENMLRKDDIKLDYADKNEFTHYYTLVLKPDNTYKVMVDGTVRAEGNLGDGQFSKFPLKEIDDPSDKKPADWVEEPKMADPTASKPEDWDESAPRMIQDATASKPEDWNEEEDGEWEAPMVENEAYKGKWVAPQIDNPLYKGKWAAKKIPNPLYKGDSYVYENIGTVGFELWVVNSGSIFSNILITDSEEEAQQQAARVFSPELLAKEKEVKKALDEKNRPAEDKSQDAEMMGDMMGGDMPEDLDDVMDEEEHEEL